MPPVTKKLLRNISLIVLDVDGVLTDGRIIINSDGTESKNFHVRDGMGIALAVKAGYRIAIISGRYSKVIELRARELKIHDVYQDAGDKLAAFRHLLKERNLSAAQAAFMGDDINDIEVLKAAGFSAAPCDADAKVKKAARWVSQYAGGKGAVREIIEMIMTAQGKWPGK